MAKLNSLLLVVAFGLASSLAVADDLGVNPGYLSTPYTNSDNSSVIKTAYGTCVHNGYYQANYGQDACGESPAPKQKITKTVTFSESGTSLFNFNASTLSAAGQQKLIQIIKQAESDGRIDDVDVIGHTDMIGAESYNQQLSQQRANVVRDFLIAQGVESDTITATGVGPQDAKASPACIQKYGSAGLAEINQITANVATATPSQLSEINAELAKFARQHQKLVNCASGDRRVEITIEQSKDVAADQ